MDSVTSQQISAGNVAVARCLHLSCCDKRLCPGFVFLPRCCYHRSRELKVVLLSFCSGSSFSSWNLVFQTLGVHRQEEGRDASCLVDKSADAQDLFLLIEQYLFLCWHWAESYWQMMQLWKGLSLSYACLFEVANVTYLNTKLWS